MLLNLFELSNVFLLYLPTYTDLFNDYYEAVTC